MGHAMAWRAGADFAQVEHSGRGGGLPYGYPQYGVGNMDWKELNSGVCKIIQGYCGELKNEELLKIGLEWLDELEAGEVANARARNPHELLRLLEVFNIITVGRMMFEASRARKASSTNLGFIRTDYPEVDLSALAKRGYHPQSPAEPEGTLEEEGNR